MCLGPAQYSKFKTPKKNLQAYSSSPSLAALPFPRLLFGFLGLAFPTGFFAGGADLLTWPVFTDLEAVDEQGGRMWRQNSGVQAGMPIHAYITLLYDFYMYAYKSNHQIVQRHIHLCKLRILCQEVFRHIRPCFFLIPKL